MRKRVTLIKVEPKRTNVYSAFAYPGLALPLLGTVLKKKGYDVLLFIDPVDEWVAQWSSDAEGVPTLRGGALWRPSSVQRATGYRRPGRGIEVDP